jgi:predicted DNA-binding WGR domain protein
MQKHFFYEDGKSRKFWSISTNGSSFTVRYGKTGTGGQEKTKAFGSAELCEQEAGKLVAEKLKKGYVLPGIQPSDLEALAREAGSTTSGGTKRKRSKSTDIPSVYYLDGVAFGPSSVYTATQLETLDPREFAHTRMIVYAPGRQPKPFSYHDFEANIVSIHAYKVLPEDRHRFVGLDRQGEVHFRRGGSDPNNRVETLPGAGLLGSNLGGLMTHLREIDGHLWACGHRGQVFRRFGTNDWRHMDGGLFEPKDPSSFQGSALEYALSMVEGPMLNCIDGNGESDVYAVGDKGLIVHYDGVGWKRIPSGTSEHLQWVRCYGADEVWACGFGGTLLKGSAGTGFSSMSSAKDDQTWVCLTKYSDRIYLCEEGGLYAYDGERIAPMVTNLEPELQDAWRVDHADGVLWSIGVKDLARFDGEKWERIHHPDNARIGA